MKTIIRLLAVILITVSVRGVMQAIFANHKPHYAKSLDEDDSALVGQTQTINTVYKNKEWITSHIEGSPIIITAPGEFLPKVSTLKQKLGDERVSSIKEFSMETSRQDFKCNIGVSEYESGVKISLQGAADGAINNLTKTLPFAHAEPIQDITIGNIPAKRVIVHGKAGSFNLLFDGIVFKYGNKSAMIMIVYNSDNSTYHTEAERIISSIMLKM